MLRGSKEYLQVFDEAAGGGGPTILAMDSRRIVSMMRWTMAALALAMIVLVYQRWLHVNPTTVALTLLLLVLTLAAKWGLRYAAVTAVVATACYNFYFLPPVGTFTIKDPQNWLALLAFLMTAVVGSRLSERAREEAEDARRRQGEQEVLFRLGRELLQTENVVALLNALPPAIAGVTTAQSVVLFLLEGDRLYQTGADGGADGGPDMMSTMETPHLRQLALTLPGTENSGEEARVPLHAGVRPRGLLLLRGVALSAETLQAIGDLTSIAIDRAQALEDVARGEAARESERLRTLMIDSITHELRTPLTSIKGAATTLLSPGNLDEASRQEMLHVIDEESDRLNRLVSQVVEMAQLETQQVRMVIVPCEVAELIERAREACAWIEDEHTITVKAPELPRVLADEEFIEKVLCNLLENAAKYSAAGAPIVISAQIQGSPQASGESVAISVADHGMGIDSGEQALVFDRFYRAREHSGSTPGTGMGLAISRAIVEAHHGNIMLTSQPEKGSVFTFTLPVAPAE